MAFYAVLDDIAVLLDDAAVLSKVAARKTAGLLGDDLAVNAEKATGFHASRELPVLWTITKGSFRNKLIILPLAFLLSAYAPWLVVPVLLLGGTYLSYEGAEKIVEIFVPHKKHAPAAAQEFVDAEELLKREVSEDKIGGTDRFHPVHRDHCCRPRNRHGTQFADAGGCGKLHCRSCNRRGIWSGGTVGTHGRCGFLPD